MPKIKTPGKEMVAGAPLPERDDKRVMKSRSEGPDGGAYPKHSEKRQKVKNNWKIQNSKKN